LPDTRIERVDMKKFLGCPINFSLSFTLTTLYCEITTN
jgi:hypothetical protein